ncbi:MAG: hypothetical protein EXS16_01570 [Gemmataceae bacterium]|nr:hypothetical protein [Gemmataceae bacterium]
MIATFCLRLAAGMILILPALPASDLPPRFFRVHFLTALGLLGVVGVFVADSATPAFWALYAGAILWCVFGSIVWHLNDAPGGRLAIWITPIVLSACMVLGGMLIRSDRDSALRVADDIASALVVGSAITAMLIGHSYLISPAMTITPLMRLLAALGIAILIRLTLACYGLWIWSTDQRITSMETELLLWLSVRWALGLFAPMILGWMAWETARIRSTQSATGILYVVVIVCFLGELTSMLIAEKTGFPL